MFLVFSSNQKENQVIQKIIFGTEVSLTIFFFNSTSLGNTISVSIFFLGFNAYCIGGFISYYVRENICIMDRKHCQNWAHIFRVEGKGLLQKHVLPLATYGSTHI